MVLEKRKMEGAGCGMGSLSRVFRRIPLEGKGRDGWDRRKRNGRVDRRCDGGSLGLRFRWEKRYRSLRNGRRTQSILQNVPSTSGQGHNQNPENKGGLT